jgi:CheY-like chemotaxis protein
MKDIQILFVDDEPVILHAIGRLLYQERYTLHFAENGVEALDVMAKTPIQVLVTDMKMPKMDGLSLLRKVKKLYPDTVRLALSGYLQIGQLLPCINSGEIFRFIIKPAQTEDLKQALQDAIDSSSSANVAGMICHALSSISTILSKSMRSMAIILGILC